MIRKFVFILLSGLPLAYSQAAHHHPQAFLQSIKGTKNEGQQIVQHFCANCHATNPLIPLGAPKIGDPQDWAPRVKQGIQSLFQHTEEGFNAMPARGGCFECSDDQLMLAIIFLLPETLKKDLLVKPKRS